MSVFDKHRDTLEVHETMMGPARGRLAVALDLLTDSLALVGQHGVYCRSERFPGRPRMDIALVLEQLDDAKQLVQSAIEEMRPKYHSAEPPLEHFFLPGLEFRRTRQRLAGLLPTRQDEQPQHSRQEEQQAQDERDEAGR